MAKIAASKITTKGQVTIPEPIRAQLHLQAGDSLEWRATDHGTVEVRKLGGELKTLVGLLGRPRRSLTVAAMDSAIGGYLDEKHRGRR